MEECKEKCWENCSCTAYANSDITESGSGFSGCILWFSDLLDLRQFPDGGQDLYVRVDISQIGTKFYLFLSWFRGTRGHWLSNLKYFFN